MLWVDSYRERHVITHKGGSREWFISTFFHLGDGCNLLLYYAYTLLVQ